MKRIKCIFLAICLLMPVLANAQDWDCEKYPDYDPTYSNPDPALVKFVSKTLKKATDGQPLTRKKALQLASEMGLPDHVNNANTKYFPPIFNQSGGSCGSASRIAYMFTHELNSYRDINSSTMENNYPTHFVWLLTNGNSGKDAFVTKVGVPTSATYGGRTYSSLFGYSEETDSCFGWMTGYNKWFSAFGNRMLKPTTNPYSLGTEEGRLAAKAWLYNHAGDETYHAGGLIGLGVASGGTWVDIPKTEQNDAIGVTGMKYVKKWGTSVDHALTMVGYDDRIEFDLDGNGIYGEESKDERGAWIIANSWGSGWCNNGFVYCPYAYGGPSFNSEGKFSGGFWTGELYHTRKDYRPLRTIKLRMDYSRRSELKLQLGISADLSATAPEQIIDMEHFRYAGDGHNGNTNPAPEVPMLGKWADRKMHTEPMEFGYDVTDLTSGFDRSRPLKYFFIVNTRSWGLGEGHIYEASIIDYEHDRAGVETPFDLGETGQVEVHSAGAKTVISTVVYGAALNVPQNLAMREGLLTWDKPMLSGHKLQGYVLYHDAQRMAVLPATQNSYDITETGAYALSARYEGDVESAQVSVASAVERQLTNQVVNFNKGGFSIPDIFTSNYSECTIEFYIKPNSFVNYNNMFGPGWGTFLAHCNSDGSFAVGWDTGNHRIASSQKLTRNNWTHVTIVVNRNKMTLYFGQTQVGAVTSTDYSGIGGFGNLVFSNGGSNYQDASYDEIRIWNRARTLSEIKGTYNREFYGDVHPDGLIAYFKGDIIELNGQSYLRDCIGGHHALLTNMNYAQVVPDKQPALYRPKDTTNKLAINQPTEPVYAGIPVTLGTDRGDGIRTLAWDIPALDIADWHITSPAVTFPSAGEYTVIVTGSDYEADGPDSLTRTISDTTSITVIEAPAPSADFTLTASEIASGDRVSFKSANSLEGYIYQWSMPGADVETAGTPSAAATYQKAGTYVVTLTVTAPSGKQSEKSREIIVSEVAPIADFTLSQAVVLKGNTVRLTSTSKHNPTDFQWTLASSVQRLIVQNADHYNFTPTEPGIYNVTLKATNEKGSNQKTQERAIIVTNDDSRNGLTFSQSAAQVTLSKPIYEEESVQKLTIEWWMNPSKLSSYCLGMGESTSTFMLRTDANGQMHFHNGTRTVKSGNGYVIAGQWHHYAIVYNKGAVKFYRDTEQIASLTNAGATLTLPATFSIGTQSAQMTGSIDEFRIWGNTLTSAIFQTICNQTMTDPEYYITGEKANYDLRLYYAFNQSGGDVLDQTSYGNDGLRTGFGPDGDAWDLSSGVFCLNFGSKQDDVIIDGVEDILLPPYEQRESRTVYDLSGRRIDASSLRPGLYIIGGRKVFVR